MNESLKNIRARIAASVASTKAFYARNRVLVLGGLTMLSILLIVWARLGFTLDFNRFYANQCTNNEACNFGEICQFDAEQGANACVPAPAGPPPQSACRWRDGSPKVRCTISEARKEGGGRVSVDYVLDASSAANLCQGNSDLRIFVDFEDVRGLTRQEPVSSGPYRLEGTASHTFTTPGQKVVYVRGGVAPESDTGFDCGPTFASTVTITEADLGGGGVLGGGVVGGGAVGGGVVGGGVVGGGGEPAVVTPPSPGTLRLDSCANGTAQLSWTPGANDNENLLRRIYTDNTNSWQTLINDLNVTSYTDSIPSGISYNYQVKSGPDTVSNTVTCANSGGSTAPASITTRCEGWPTPRVIVNWTIPSDAVQNTVRRTGTAGSFTDPDAILVNPPAGTTTYTDTTVQTGATYGYMYRPVGTVNPRSDITINAASCGGPVPTATLSPSPMAPTITFSPKDNLCLGEGYEFTGSVTGGKPNTSVHLFVQRPDGSMLFSDSTEFALSTDSEGKGSDTRFFELDSRTFQVGTYTGWVTIGGIQSNKLTGTIRACEAVAVACAPVSQTVSVGQQAKLTASGGSGATGFSWKTLGAQSVDVFNSGSFDQNLTVTYRTPGAYTVTARTGGGSATCEIEVVGEQGPPASSAGVALTVTGRNASSGAPEGITVGARGGQQVEVIMRARNTSTTAILANLLFRGSLPPGLTYVKGSTTYNNAKVALDSVATSGLGVGSLGPSQEATVRFKAQVIGASFPVGTTQASIVAAVSADGVAQQSGSVVVAVTRPAAGSTSSGAVPTGPGDAVLVALLVSGIVTLLYVSYTHSPLYRRQEVEHLSEDQGPMDFRA